VAENLYETVLGLRQGLALHIGNKALLSRFSISTFFPCQRYIVWIVGLEKAVSLNHPSTGSDVDP